MGIGFDEFCRLTFDEFAGVCKAWERLEESRSRQSWEQTRLLAAICIQPHLKKKITPRQLVQLPWDNENLQREAPAALSPEERLERFEKLARQ